MKTPLSLQPLMDDGLVDEVVRRLKSGKEADVYVVRCGEQLRCAKVYKDVATRSFKQAVHYREGRKVRNSRSARAMEKGSKFGRQQQESHWQHAEVDALYRLAAAGVRVPQPYGCFDGVLLMELITDGAGQVAPRLSDLSFEAEQARQDHATLMNHVVRMLCAGLVHGDLSEFNVLRDAAGPVIIDLPQVVHAAANNHAKDMLVRDVDNLSQFYGQFAPELRGSRYAQEIWAHYEAGDLTEQVRLTGQFAEPTQAVDLAAVLDEIQSVEAEALARLARRQASDASE